VHPVADERNLGDEPAAPGAAPDEESSIGGGVFAPRPVIKKRRSRKERHEDLAQPDEFVEVGGTIVDWLVSRSKVVGIAIAAVLVSLLVGAVNLKMTTSTEAEASGKLFQARQLLPAKTSTPLGGGLSFDLSGGEDAATKLAKTEESVKQLEAVAQEFRGTPQATQAQVLAGQALYDLGEYERALVFLDAGAKARGIAGDRARNLRGFTLLALDRAPEAVTVFAELREQSLGASRAYATMNLAAAHEAAGDSEKARGVYELFETEFPDSDLLSEVQVRASANATP